MRLLGSGLVAAFGLLCVLAACENQAAPGPGPKPTVPTYTVSFDSDGGTPIAGIKVRKGVTIDLRDKYFQTQQTGYFFNGWFLKDDPSPVLRSRTSITVNENITLVAKWIKYCVVSLEMGEGGTLGGNTELSVLPGTLLEAGGYKPFRKGFIFRYWYLKDDPSEAKRDSIRVDSDITLVAAWKEGWAVTLVLNGGVYPRDYITVDKDDGTLDLAGVKPVKANSVFEGWYYNAGFTEPVPDEITVTENITLYVKWLPLNLFEDLLGVWTRAPETYFLYLEECRLYGFYFSSDEVRSFAWSDKTLDGKGYTSGSRSLTVGTGTDAKTFTLVTEKTKPAGNARLTGMWVKGELEQIILPGDPEDPEVPTPPPVDGIEIKKEGEILFYNFTGGIWLCLDEDGRGYVRANGGTVDISYVVTNLNLLYLLRRNEKVTESGVVLDEGEVLLRLPIVPILDEEGKEVGIKPDGFEPFGLRPF
jgi:uncharacterized repeat protein (TIGR02543 family)